MSLVSVLSEASLLSDRNIKKLIEDDELTIDPYDVASVNPTSYDLHLGSTLVVYPSQVIKVGTSIPISQEIDISNSSYTLRPGEFLLGTTKEKVSIPDGYQGVIETKGNIARAGLQVHNNDGHIDPGFCGNITLEIKNMNSNDVSVELVAGTAFCQLFIGQLTSSCDSPYQGKYLNQTKPTVYYP
jgi:dCTP deaminase